MYVARLNYLNLTTLETRLVRTDMLLVWKIVNGLGGVPEERFFIRSGTGNTRGHMEPTNSINKDSGLIWLHFQSKIGLFQSGNLLPTDVLSARSINCFKRNLDKYMRLIRRFKNN